MVRGQSTTIIAANAHHCSMLILPKIVRMKQSTMIRLEKSILTTMLMMGDDDEADVEDCDYDAEFWWV